MWNQQAWALVLFCVAVCDVFAAEPPSVTLLASSPRAFQVASGGFLYTYDAAKDESVIVTRQEAPGPARFEIACAPGAGLMPLAGGIVQAIHATDTSESLAIQILSSRAWADFETRLLFPKRAPGLLNWRVEVSAKTKQSLPASDFDVLFGTAPLTFTDLGRDYPAQVPLAWFQEGAMNATCLFYADYTTLNPYFILTRTRPAFAVGIDNALAPHTPWTSSRPGRKGFGYYRPASAQPIPPGARFTIAHSWCYLVAGLPKNENDMAGRFIRCLAAIYPYMAKPETVETDWPTVARRQIRDLQRPECWTRPFGGRRHLLPYVNHTDPNCNDLMTELQILVPLARLNQVAPTSDSLALAARLADNVKAFYIPERKMFHNMITASRDSIVVDNFYAGIHALMLGDLVRRGIGGPELRQMYVAFIDTCIRVGRSLQYQFPYLADWVSGRPVDEAKWFHEYDVGGALADAFLDCYEITGDRKYLDESKIAVESMKGHGFALPHEIHLTAAGLAACGRLYKITGDRAYLDLARLPLANILRRCWFWDGDYDYGRYFQFFFALSFAKNGPQIAPQEYVNAWDFIREFYLAAGDALDPDSTLLVTEFHKWALTNLRYFYPPLLPREAIAPGPASWPVNPALYVALEDMTDGNTRLGLVGQGIYMSRAGIELAATAYRRLPGGVTLFSEYPILEAAAEPAKKTITLRLGGVPDTTCKIKVQSQAPLPADLACTVLQKGQPPRLWDRVTATTDSLVIEVPGGSELRLAPGEGPLRGVHFEARIERETCVAGDHVKAEMLFEAPASVNPDSVRFGASLPCRREGRTLWIDVPPTLVPGARLDLVTTASYECQGTRTVLARRKTLRVVEALTLAPREVPGDFAAPGKPYWLRMQVANNASRRIRARLAVAGPAGWVVAPLPAELTLAPGERRAIDTSLTPGAGARPEESEIEFRVTDGQTVRREICVVRLAQADRAFIDRGERADLWTQAGKNPRVDVRAEGGKLIFGPTRHPYGAMEREVCIDLDRYPYLSIKVDKGGVDWALYLDDGKHFPAIGVRIQQDTWQTGVFHYDLRQSTDWHGIKQFKLRYTVIGVEQSCIVDWLAIGDRPLTEEPPPDIK